jgi:hypothetical protein
MNLDGEIELSERNEVSQARVLARENLKEGGFLINSDCII